MNYENFKSESTYSKSLFKHNIMFYVLNGFLFTIMMNLFKPFTAKFLYRIGGSDFHISLLNALPGLVAVFSTIPGILIINDTINKRKTMNKFFFSSRLFILLFAAIPLLPIKYQPIIFVILISLKQYPESVSVTSLQSFTGDIFPEQKRATAISSRNMFSIIAQLMTVLLVDYILKHFGKTNNIILKIYQIFFIVSFLIGLIEIYTFSKLKENSQSSINRNSNNHKKSIFYYLMKTPEVILSTKNNKKYWVFILCSLIYHFGWQMGWPLFSIYQIKYLGADEHWIAIISIVSSITMFFCYKFWNVLIDKKGNPPVMAVTTLGMAATPLLYAFSPNLKILATVSVISAFFTSGTVTVLLNSLLEVTPDKDRIFYVGIHVTLTSITLSIAPIVGNIIQNHFSIYFALYASAFFRLLGSIAFFIRNRKVNLF